MSGGPKYKSRSKQASFGVPARREPRENMDWSKTARDADGGLLKRDAIRHYEALKSAIQKAPSSELSEGGKRDRLETLERAFKKGRGSAAKLRKSLDEYEFGKAPEENTDAVSEKTEIPLIEENSPEAKLISSAEKTTESLGEFEGAEYEPYKEYYDPISSYIEHEMDEDPEKVFFGYEVVERAGEEDGRLVVTTKHLTNFHDVREYWKNMPREEVLKIENVLSRHHLNPEKYRTIIKLKEGFSVGMRRGTSETEQLLLEIIEIVKSDPSSMPDIYAEQVKNGNIPKTKGVVVAEDKTDIPENAPEKQGFITKEAIRVNLDLIKNTGTVSELLSAIRQNHLMRAEENFFVELNFLEIDLHEGKEISDEDIAKRVEMGLPLNQEYRTAITEKVTELFTEKEVMIEIKKAYPNIMGRISMKEDNFVREIKKPWETARKISRAIANSGAKKTDLFALKHLPGRSSVLTTGLLYKEIGIDFETASEEEISSAIRSAIGLSGKKETEITEEAPKPETQKPSRLEDLELELSSQKSAPQAEEAVSPSAVVPEKPTPETQEGAPFTGNTPSTPMPTETIRQVPSTETSEPAAISTNHPEENIFVADKTAPDELLVAAPAAVALGENTGENSPDAPDEIISPENAGVLENNAAASEKAPTIISEETRESETTPEKIEPETTPLSEQVIVREIIPPAEPPRQSLFSRVLNFIFRKDSGDKNTTHVAGISMEKDESTPEKPSDPVRSRLMEYGLRDEEIEISYQVRDRYGKTVISFESYPEYRRYLAGLSPAAKASLTPHVEYGRKTMARMRELAGSAGEK